MSDNDVFNRLNHILADANEFNGIFYHGALTAVGLQPISSDEKDDLTLRLGGPLDDNCKQLLQELAIQLQTQLDSAEFDYTVPIGEADDGLLSDIECLADWCRGFLVGWSVGTVKVDALDEEHQGVMQDILAISEVAAVGDEDADDLYEIVEYVRVAILNIHEQLNPITRAPIQTNDQMGEPVGEQVGDQMSGQLQDDDAPPTLQ